MIWEKELVAKGQRLFLPWISGIVKLVGIKIVKIGHWTVSSDSIYSPVIGLSTPACMIV